MMILIRINKYLRTNKTNNHRTNKTNNHRTNKTNNHRTNKTNRHSYRMNWVRKETKVFKMYHWLISRIT